MKGLRITAELSSKPNERGRFHFVLLHPEVGKLVGTPGVSRSVATFSSAREAIRVALRNWPGAIVAKKRRNAVNSR